MTMLFPFVAKGEVTSLSAMSTGEISRILATAPVPEIHESTVTVNADDLVTKVYGLLSTNLTKSATKSEAARLLHVTPSDEEGVLWLDSETGYGLNYDGMTPEVSAMARFFDPETADTTNIAKAKVNDFGFFFLFPYEEASKECVNRNQAEFCSALLTELKDMGVALGVNTASTDLFEVLGNYNGNNIDMRLFDEGTRYVLMVAVEPIRL